MDINKKQLEQMAKEEPKKFKRKSQLEMIWIRYKKNKLALFGLAVFLFIVIVSVSTPLFIDYRTQVIKQNIMDKFQTSSAAHLLGTDQFGRDILCRLLWGARYSILCGLGVMVLSLSVGAILGASAGYFGGIVDNVISRIMDVFMCVPPILLSLAVVAALGTNLRNLIIAITVSCIPGNVRLIRSVVLTTAEQDYVEAAKSYGTSNARIIFRYVLPNAMGPIIVNTTMSISDMMLSAAGLSFIGMGIQPPSPEWGALLSNAQTYLFSAPYMLLFPGMFILLSSLAFNLVGDGLTDALDPKLKD